MGFIFKLIIMVLVFFLLTCMPFVVLYLSRASAIVCRLKPEHAVVIKKLLSSDFNIDI